MLFAINRNTLKEESVCGKKFTFFSGLNSIQNSQGFIEIYRRLTYSFIDIYFTVAMVLRGWSWLVGGGTPSCLLF